MVHNDKQQNGDQNKTDRREFRNRDRFGLENVEVPSRPGLELGSTGDDTRALNEVLDHFGLVTFDEDETPDDELLRPAIPSVAGTENEFTDVTADGLRRLQGRWGLPTTGVLDNETFAAIQGVSCFSPPLPVRDAIGKPDDTKMTYAILNFPSGLSAARVASAVSQAFAFWAAATPLSFLRVPGPAADLTVRFPSLGGPEGVLGNALIELDDDEKWRIGSEQENVGGASYDLISTLVHEIGHRLGLRHVTASHSVMREYQSHSTEHRQIGGFDAAAVQEIHGQQTVTARPVIHGNTARAEHPERLALIRPTGPGGVFVGDAQSTWIHISPTIPNVIQGYGVRLHRIRLKLRLFPGARVTEVHIWDGDHIRERHVLELRSETPDTTTLMLGVASKPVLVDGLEVSIGVAFDQRHADVDRRIDVISAGCDLIDREQQSGKVLA